MSNNQQNQAINPSHYLIALSAKNQNRLHAMVENLLNYLKANGHLIESRIADVAFTLQTGREEMEERLAFVVSDYSDLINQLSDYLEGAASVKAIYRGQINLFDQPVQGSKSRTQKEIDCIRMIRIHDMQGLAELFVLGVHIDWNPLYVKGSPRRIALPGYPFAPERHWVTRQYLSSLVTKTSSVQNSHPLLDERDDSLSLESGLVFRKLLHINDRVLQDHQVNETSVFPGVAYIEMAYAALAQLSFSNPEALQKTVLKQMVWLQALTVTEPKHEIFLLLEKEAQGIKFEVKDDQTLYAKGRFDQSGDLSKREPSLELEKLKACCPRVKNHQDIYQDFHNSGLSYGTWFQGLEQTWFSEGGDAQQEGEALGLFKIPLIYESQLSAYTFHPGLLDAALQTVASVPGYCATGSGDLLLPYAVEKLEWFQPFPACGYSHVRQIAKNRFDITICDEQGNVCAKFSDLSVRPSRSPDPEPSLNKLTYRGIWLQQELGARRSAASRPAKTGTVLIIHSPKQWALAQELKEVLAKAHGENQVLRMCLNSKDWDFKYLENWNHRISAIQELREIYFISAMEQTVQSGNSTVDTLDFANSQERGLLSLFRLLKVLDKNQMLLKPLSLKVLTTGNYRILPRDTIHPFSAGLQGFCRSISQEYPLLALSCIDLECMDGEAMSADSLKKLAQLIVAEPAHQPNETVGIREHRRYIRKLVSVCLPEPTLAQGDQRAFKYRGVYLIVGGAGGIGMALAQYLAVSVQARLVLVGRSAIDTDKKQKISALAAAGGEALYIQADICCLESMKNAVAKARQRFGKIDGVVHSAIVLNDQSLSRMSEEVLRASLAPKVEGSIVLQQAMTTEQLDFMLFFSSAISFSGNAGQSNYAAGCTFKDAFAHYLTQVEDYPVFNINWGYWGSVGVVANDAYRKRWAAKGVHSIAPTQGMKVIESILINGIDQIVAVNVDKPFLERLGVDMSLTQKVLTQHSPSLIAKLPRLALPEIGQFQKNVNRLEKLSAFRWAKVFKNMLTTSSSQETYSRSDLKQQLQVSSEHHRLFDVLITILIKEGYLSQQGESLLPTPLLNGDRFQQQEAEVKLLENELSQTDDAYLKLLSRCLDHYPAILRAELVATEIIFPQGSMEWVEGIYRHNASADYFNQQLAERLVAYIQARLPSLDARESIHILEIGAGTGGTSAIVFKALQPYARANASYLLIKTKKDCKMI
ncbi:MAG: SDR family NAD(P)-dependent oxidoreductase [Nostoc sp.]|uniref:SDR family oxidoreductase n=1 Tax=Nostoc sp. TaxID=1180 RepID=UPI002FF6D080